MIVHPRRQTAFAIARHGVGGHGDNRQAHPIRQRTDGARRGESIHHRHLHVHQHNIVDRATHLFHCGGAVGRQINIQLELAQERGRHFLIELVVFDQQHPAASEDSEIRRRLGPVPGRVGCHRLGAPTQLGREPERGTLAGRALDPHFSPHQFRQPLRDGQPQPRSAVLAGGGDIGLLETLEQQRQLVRLDANPGVAHRKA